MKYLPWLLAAVVLVGAGVAGTFGVQQLVVNDSESHVDVYVDRTPAPQELEIRLAAQKLIDDYNARRWDDVWSDFASFCHLKSSSAAELGASWESRPDQTWHFELRKFSLIEVHDNTAQVDTEVVLIDNAGVGKWGPDQGSQPWLRTFTFEDGRWRACQ